jgi:hypothetical protein
LTQRDRSTIGCILLGATIIALAIVGWTQLPI